MSLQVLVLFYGDDEFKAITVSSQATAEDVLNDSDLQTQLDKAGINNRSFVCYIDRMFVHLYVHVHIDIQCVYTCMYMYM